MEGGILVMGKKDHGKNEGKKKLTKKEQKALNHLKLVQNKKSKSDGSVQIEESKKNKTAA